MSGLLARAVTGYQLRSYQQHAVDRGVAFLTDRKLRGRNGLIVLPTGSGKSLVIAGLATRLNEPTLVFQPSKEILEQNAEKLRGYGFYPGIWSASAGQKRLGLITLATIGSVVRDADRFRAFKYVLIDECFVAGTMVDGRPIEHIRPGDFVHGFDHIARRIVRARVVATSRRRTGQPLVRVTVGGRAVTCTANHPFYVHGLGYLPAADLRIGDECADWSLPATAASDAALLALRAACDPEERASRLSLPPNGPSVSQGVCAQARRAEPVGSNAGPESDARRRGEGAHVGVAEADRAPADGAWRQREAHARAAAPAPGGVGVGVGSGARSAHEAAVGGVSALLQDRRGASGVEGGGGDRRAESRACQASVGRAEDGVLGIARVERVEVLEHGCDDGHAGGAGDGYVYNLEVEGVNNYFANGILVHNCHLVNPKGGMYRSFLDVLSHSRALGLTATPYRLASAGGGSELRFLTRTRPRIFDDVVYYLNLAPLFRAGFLAPLTYHESDLLRGAPLKLNSSGADFDDQALRQHFRACSFTERLERTVRQLLDAGHQQILVFTRFTEEATALAAALPSAAVVSAKTPSDERARILWSFRHGLTKVVANVGVLTTGFDYPELTTVVLARPTMSLGLFYQMVGRVIRPHPSKPTAHVVDLVGLKRRFGPIEQLWMQPGGHNGKQWVIVTGEQRDRVLTNVCFGLPRGFAQARPMGAEGQR